jgi:hypothetical protein
VKFSVKKDDFKKVAFGNRQPTQDGFSFSYVMRNDPHVLNPEVASPILKEAKMSLQLNDLLFIVASCCR